jgi:hypothetical protein
MTLPDGSQERTTYRTTYQPWEDFYVYGPGVFAQSATGAGPASSSMSDSE